jgi:hypothetical protein
LKEVTSTEITNQDVDTIVEVENLTQKNSGRSIGINRSYKRSSKC